MRRPAGGRRRRGREKRRRERRSARLRGRGGGGARERGGACGRRETAMAGGEAHAFMRAMARRRAGVGRGAFPLDGKTQGGGETGLANALSREQSAEKALQQHGVDGDQGERELTQAAARPACAYP